MKAKEKITDREQKNNHGQRQIDKSMAEITEIIKEYETPLLRYANRYLRNSENARDIVQETFIKFVRISQNEAKAEIKNISAWLYKITRNLCLDHLRSSKRKQEVSIDENIADFADTESPDKTLEKREEMQLVRKQIMELDTRSREILLLKLDQGKSYKEIAAIMNIQTGNVGFILHRAIKTIAAALKNSHKDTKARRRWNKNEDL